MFEVSTDSADALRARLTVVGALTVETVALLTSAITTHLTAGRRYLRVDVSAAQAGDTAVLDAVTELYDRTTALGGMLVFDGAASSGTAPVDALSAHVAGLRSRA